MLYSTVGRGDNAYFLSNGGLLGLVISINIFLFRELMGIGTFLVFNIKGMRAISNGEKINYNFRKIFMLRRIIHSLILIIFITALLSFPLGNNIVGALKVFIIAALLVVLFKYIISFIEKKNYKNKKFIIPVMYMVLILAVFSVSTNLILTEMSKRDYTHDYKKLNSVSSLKLEDFNDVSKEDSLYFRLEKTPIDLYLLYSNGGEKDYLSYEIFESKYKWAVKYNFNKKVKYNNKLGVKYTEKEFNLSKDIKVYINDIGYEYIIISPNKMVSISSLENISDEELINIVYEKIFK